MSVDDGYLTRLAAVEAEQVVIERMERLAAGRAAVVEEQVRSGRVAVRYAGPGFVLGVPARDLTAEEWAGLSVEQQGAVGQSGVYVFEIVEEDEEGVNR